MQWSQRPEELRLASEPHLASIPTFPGYLVEDNGQIWSERRGGRKLLSVKDTPVGLRVSLWNDAHQKMVTLHPARLIASVFHGPSSASVGYVDGNRLSISAANLFWKNDAGLDILPPEFSVIPGYDGYFVSRDGRIISNRSLLGDGLYRLLSPTPERQGYLRVSVATETKEKTLKVHLAVITTFKGPRPSPVHQCRHLDGNNQNNSVDNLEWGLPSENAADRLAHGTQPRGEAHAVSKLTNSDAALIRQMLTTGRFSQAEIATKFNISAATVGRIHRGESWTGTDR